jgi:hypothetical protein
MNHGKITAGSEEGSKEAEEQKEVVREPVYDIEGTTSRTENFCCI